MLIRFRQVIALGNKLLKSNPELQEVKDTIERLKAEEAAIARGWKEKELWLQQCLQLQMFNKEADNIDAVTSAHQAFLEFSDLGVSIKPFLITLIDKKLENLSINDDTLSMFSTAFSLIFQI